MGNLIVDIKSIKKPLVSIIVATYRRDDSLEKALFSLIDQTYENIEIIVVDDNADTIWNGKVKNIIKKISFRSKFKIYYVKNVVNKGSAITRNIGIETSVGEYITFLDDDDLYLSCKVKNQLEHMEKENSDFSLTDLYLYNNKNAIVEKRQRKYIKLYNKDSLLRYHLLYHMTGTDVIMFKRDYLIKIGMFSPINIGDEFYLMLKAIEGNGKFSYLACCDVKAYIHQNSNNLSNGDQKIRGENELFEYKAKYFNLISKYEIQTIKMRHYAVLAFVEIKRKNFLHFFKYTVLAFFSNPIQCIRLICNRI